MRLSRLSMLCSAIYPTATGISQYSRVAASETHGAGITNLCRRKSARACPPLLSRHCPGCVHLAQLNQIAAISKPKTIRFAAQIRPTNAKVLPADKRAHCRPTSCRHSRPPFCWAVYPHPQGPCRLLPLQQQHQQHHHRQMRRQRTVLRQARSGPRRLRHRRRRAARTSLCIPAR